jgi:hypothetical protein
LTRDPKTASSPPVFEQLSLLQVRLCKLALLLGDLLALVLAFGLATVIAVWLVSNSPGP